MKNVILSLSMLCFLAPVAALANHHDGAMKEPTKEERTQMVDLYSKMADCLKTEKPMADCHKEVVASCPMAKAGKCPMMMGHHHADGEHGKKGKGKKQ